MVQKKKAATRREKKPEVQIDDALRILVTGVLREVAEEEDFEIDDDKEVAEMVEGIIGRLGDGIIELVSTSALMELEESSD